MSIRTSIIDVFGISDPPFNRTAYQIRRFSRGKKKSSGNPIVLHLTSNDNAVHLELKR